MALMELEPPSTLPRGQKALRLSSAASGCAWYIQLKRGSLKVRP